MYYTKVMCALFLMVLIAGCSSIYRQDGLELLEKSNIATIELSSCKVYGCPIIQEIDGKWRGIGTFEMYELKPGVRTVKFIYMAGTVRGNEGIIVEFLAEEGKDYEVRTNANHDRMTWNPVIYDKLTGSAVSRKIGTAPAY